MLVNEYRLEIQFKKVRNVRNIHSNGFQWSGPASIGMQACAERTLQHRSLSTIYNIRGRVVSDIQTRAEKMA